MATYGLASVAATASDWKSAAIVPVGAGFALPDELASGYYKVVRNATPGGETAGVITAASYADLVTMLKGGPGSTEDAKNPLRPFVQETQEIQYLTSDLAASLGYLSAEASYSQTKIVVVERWSKFVDVVVRPAGYENARSKPVRNDITLKVGFSISLVTRVDATEKRLDLGKLIRAFSANFSFEKVSLTSNTEVLGLSGREITDNLPSASDFLLAQAEAVELAESNSEDPRRAKYLALAQEAANMFNTLRSKAWDASYFQPVIIGIDLSSLEQLTGETFTTLRAGG